MHIMAIQYPQISASDSIQNCEIVIASSSSDHNNSNGDCSNNQSNNSNSNGGTIATTNAAESAGSSSVSSGGGGHEQQHHSYKQHNQQPHQSTIFSASASAIIPIPFMHFEAYAAGQAAAIEDITVSSTTDTLGGQHNGILQQNDLSQLMDTSTHSAEPSNQNFPAFHTNSLTDGHNGEAPLGQGNPEPDKRFECTVCERRFRQLSALSNHIRIHTGEKPYKCTVCDKAFRQSSTLKNHLKIHTGEKPFNCRYCRKTFRQLSTLSNHIKIHTGKSI